MFNADCDMVPCHGESGHLSPVCHLRSPGSVTSNIFMIDAVHLSTLQRVSLVRTAQLYSPSLRDYFVKAGFWSMPSHYGRDLGSLCTYRCSNSVK